MLYLLFQLGADRYALGVDQVVEVLPLVHLKTIPQAPRGVAGIFDYRGKPVPVIDLSELTVGSPAPAHLSTRLILVNYADSRGASRLLGLIAAKATETIRLEPGDFVAAGITNPEAPYLGPVSAGARGLLQSIRVNQLLPDSLRDNLFQEPL